jgi:hypothetical protein
MIARVARTRLAQLPDGRLHEAIFAAMGSLYLAQPEAWQPDRDLISRAVFAELGPFARPALLVHQVRRRGRGSGALIAGARRSWAGL